MKKNNTTFDRDNFKLSLIKNCKLVGEFEFSEIKPTQTIISKFEVIPFNVAKSVEQKQKYYVHFYIDDYQFDRVWYAPEKYMEFLKQFKGVIGPDFSLYTDMPKVMQLWNCYRSRTLTRYWQDNGIDVIPNATWSDESSYSWCFDGLPKNSTIAVSSVGCIKNARALLNFCKGFQEMDKKLKPTKILFYGIIPESLKGDKRIIQIATYMQLRLQNLNKEVII